MTYTYTMEIPDDARLEDGYIEFSGEPYLILQKRDDDGNIIAEKEIHETLENSEITSGCHGKENEEEEKKPVKSSRKLIKSGISSISFEKNLNDYSNDPTVTVTYDYDDGRDSDFYQKSIHECINDANNFISKGYRCLIDGLSVDNADAFDSSNSYLMVIKSSRKPIKSSLDERLVPYLEEFEEGYSDALTEDPMDSYAGYDSDRERCESFFKKFKNNHNLNDNDINDLENEIIYRWQKEDAEIGHDMGEMYGNHYGDAEYFK